MNTGNWQIKMLTLCMTAFTLCLTAACGDAGPEIITPSAPCGDDDYETLTPSLELREFGSIEHLYDGSMSETVWNDAAVARWERLAPERERVENILAKYTDRIWKLPGVYSSRVSALRTENGLATDKYVINISVHEHIDWSTVLPEDRIPDCLEGVPVHFEKGGPIDPD